MTNNKNLKPINKNVKIISFDKMREPYTYNFTTYLSMLFSKTNENILKIINEIKQIDKQLKKWDFSKFKSFFVILEDKFELVVPMLKVKFEELFGQEVGGDAFTYSTSLHAKTVKEDKKQLFISLNKKNDFFGFKENRLNINFKNKIGNLGMIAIGYFIVGKIQKSKPDYFKKNIKKYCIKISKKFGKEILPIVE